MSDADRGQIADAAARVYERLYVPGLFAPVVPHVLDAAGVQPGHRALDVACGTGVVTRALVERVGPGGAVTGLDVNPGMLAVAREACPGARFVQADVADLPLRGQTFDAVICQFALMFFPDRVDALARMARSVRPGGRLVVAVWDSLERTPAYATVVRLLARRFGEQAAQGMRMPFSLGEPDQLRDLLDQAGLDDADVRRLPGTGRFPDLDTWVTADVKGWTASELIDEEGLEGMRQDAREALARWIQADGSVAFEAPAYLLTWTR